MRSDWIATTERMPEPGVAVLAAFVYPGFGTHRVVRAQWADRFTLLASMEDEEGEYSEADDEYYVPPGWYETNEFEEVHWKIAESVTHWTPLPAHPFAALAENPSEGVE